MRWWDASAGSSSGIRYAPQESFGGPTSLAVADMPGGGGVVVGGSPLYGLWRWDQASGEPIGEPIRDVAFRRIRPSRLPMTVLDGPDDPAIAVGCADGFIRHWTALTGMPAREAWQAHPAEIWSLARIEGSDGEPWLVTGGADGVVRAWGPVTSSPVGVPLERCGIPVAVFRIGPGIVGVASATGNIHFGDLASGQRVAKRVTTGWQSDSSWQPWWPGDVAYAEGLVVAAVDDTVKRWDLQTSEPAGEPIAIGQEVQSIAAVDGSDGRRMLLVAEPDGSVHRLDLITGDVAASVVYPHAGRPNRLDVVPVSREQVILAVGTRGYLRCYDAHTGQHTGITLRPEVHWYGLAIADLPDGRTLLVGGHDDGITRMVAPQVTACERHPDEDTISIWDVATIALPDGRVVVAGAGHDWLLYRWDAATGQALGAPSSGHRISVKAITAAVIDGVPTLFTGCEAGQVRRWDAATGVAIGDPLPSELDHISGLTVVRTSLGLQLLVGIDLDGRVHHWDAITGQLQWTSGELSPFTPLPPSTHLLHSYQDRDGRPILVFLDTHEDQLGRWDVETHAVVRQPLPADAHAMYNDRDSIMLVRCTTNGTLVIEELV